MKLTKFMNILFYILTIICVFFTLGSIFNILSDPESNNSFSFTSLFILLTYLYSYYCHKEYSKYILDTFYIDKDMREPDEYMIENFMHNTGFHDYNCNSEVDISNYSEEEVQKALKIYEKLKYKNIKI